MKKEKKKKKKKNWVGKLTDASTRQEIVGIASTRVRGKTEKKNRNRRKKSLGRAERAFGPHAVARLTIYRP